MPWEEEDYSGEKKGDEHMIVFMSKRGLYAYFPKELFSRKAFRVRNMHKNG